MKKYITIALMAIISFAVVSCSSDSDSDSSKNNVLSGGVKVKNPSALVGKWINTRTDWAEMYYEDGYDEDTDLYNDDDNRFLVLRSDGTGYVSPYYLFEVNQHGIITWNVSGDKVIFTEHTDYHTYTTEYIVMKLNSTTLVLRWVDYYNKNNYVIETNTFKKATDNDY